MVKKSSVPVSRTGSWHHRGVGAVACFLTERLLVGRNCWVRSIPIEQVVITYNLT
ncbi:hypothetical protein AZA_75166 [Nitrospirillum viridazoti Y2]|nr:hypothetical protein AZA_75166 [Nitrospirillum amazonense Y2]